MCGRAYATYTDDEIEMRYFRSGKRRNPLPPLTQSFNLAPSQSGLVIRQFPDESRSADLLRWGLVPAWAKDEKIGYKMINARAETAFEKPSFKNAIRSRRCIVPLSGFFEWKKDPQKKRPYKLFLKDRPIMSVAGLWETWRDQLQTFTILTTEANELVRNVHDRMPVILSESDEDAWLDPKTPEDQVRKLLKAFPAQEMQSAEISELVNSPRNNRREILDPKD